VSSETSPPVTSPTTPPRALRWHLVVPVKDAGQAKSRLDTPAPLRRTDLARAVASDTVEAACTAVGADLVTVVTSDAVAAQVARDLGARVVPDPADGLNAAVAAGWEDAPDEPGHRVGWAALLGDLPALRPDDLRAALAECGRHRSAVVPDAEGTGTVLLTSTVAPPVPRFGPGSAARHAGAGAEVLPLDLPRLRRDVDLADDLRVALSLGVGRHTLLAMRRGA
jgi:2-phospho-L-lactate/phosphoenolpyruvate guanylyltransferase